MHNESRSEEHNKWSQSNRVWWVIVTSQRPKKPTVFRYLLTARVRVIPFPGRKHYKSYVINAERIKRIWQDFIDEIVQCRWWRTASLKSANKTALIGMAIYICIKSVRHSVVWHRSSYQGDPIGSHLPAAKLWSILLEMLSGTTC